MRDYTAMRNYRGKKVFPPLTFVPLFPDLRPAPEHTRLEVPRDGWTTEMLQTAFARYFKTKDDG